MREESLIDTKGGALLFSTFGTIAKIAAIIAAILYVIQFFFGIRGAEVLLNIHQYEKQLLHLIKIKKLENESLQKKLLEYNVLIPQDK
jgi:hypothetical protein